ncbi:MAG: hypothetical protein ACLRIT_12105 [Blautia sp.]
MWDLLLDHVSMQADGWTLQLRALRTASVRIIWTDAVKLAGGSGMHLNQSRKAMTEQGKEEADAAALRVRAFRQDRVSGSVSSGLS